MNKRVINVLRSLLSVLQWPVSEWPRLLAPLRHYRVILTPRQLLKNKAPIVLTPRQLLKNKAPIELAASLVRTR
jgi:hypothetical protein